MLTNRIPLIVFEAPNDGGSAASPAAFQQPTAQAPSAQGDGQEGSGNFWQFFPNVPEEHRPLIEPHIREMQGHVTKLEQQLAPFKPFVDAGLQAQDAAGLVKFSQDFDAAPVDMWLRMGTMLQDQQVLDPEIDLEYLAALARGEDPDALGGVEENGAPQTPSELEELRQQLQALQDEREQEKVSRQEQIQNQFFDRQLGKMREELVKAGIPEDILTEEALTARVIVHKGNVASATKSFVDERAAILKGFTKNKEPDDLELPNGVPDHEREEPRERDGSWGVARNKASARLRRENRAAAQ